MNKIIMSFLAWGLVLGFYALVVKVLVWAIAACNLGVLPFFPVFVGTLAIRALIGRRG